MAGKKNELKFQIWGWILFIVCAIIFIASSIRMGDGLMLAGSLFFLVACFLFLIPLLPKLKS
jgi:hypothetical protein